MTPPNNFAFIFARGGSKGLPRKNVLPLSGKPLIQYSIESAQACEQIDKVFVSTEDSEIAETAKIAGAQIIERPTHLAGDHSPEWLAWQHAVEWVNQHYGCFDLFVSLPTTSPLRSNEDILNSIKQLQSAKADCCISITKAARSPYFNMVTINNENLVEIVNKPKAAVNRRQDAPQVFDITTAVYTTTPNFILANNSLFNGKVTAIEIPKQRAVDIDDKYDFMLAEAIIKSGELNAR